MQNKPVVGFGHKVFGNRDFRCDAVHGSVNLIQAIEQSCNNYFFELGARLDVDEISFASVTQ